MQTAVGNFIKRNALLSRRQKVLVAYSGGPDSTALLLVLRELGYPVSAVYVNHNLRGKESHSEEAFVRQFCNDHKIPLFVEDLSWKTKPSNLEETARKKRYRHLLKAAHENGFRKIALAHHRDDVAENFLLRLLRGSGPQGLARLSSKRDTLIRPLLDCSRQAILEYLREQKASFFTDSSNNDLAFRRNRIRHELLPLLETYNPQARSALYRAASWIDEQNALVAGLMMPHFRMIHDEKGALKIKKRELLALAPSLQKAILQEAVQRLDPSLHPGSKTRESLLQAVQKGQNLELPGFLVVESSQDWIQVRLKTGQIGLFELDIPRAGNYYYPPGSVHLKFTPTRRTGFKRTTRAAYLDADKASFPLLVRNWKKGDAFRPLGMKGHKKLSDYLIDLKIPKADRKRLPLIFKNETLVWVAGHQISNDYRVTDQTKKVLRIELKHA